jgi:hypothetical protein
MAAGRAPAAANFTSIRKASSSTADPGGSTAKPARSIWAGVVLLVLFTHRVMVGAGC